MLVYLNFDGVLHPNHLLYRYGRAPELLSPGHTVLEYASAFAEAFEVCPDATVVLNTWWTYHLSMDACVELLPVPVRRRISGTTLASAFQGEALPNRVREAENHIGMPAKEELLVVDNSAARYRSDLLPHLLLVDEERGLSCQSAMSELKKRLCSFRMQKGT